MSARKTKKCPVLLIVRMADHVNVVSVNVWMGSSENVANSRIVLQENAQNRKKNFVAVLETEFAQVT